MRLLALLALMFWAGTVASAEPKIEVTGPIPVTETSRPFLDAAKDVAAAGYVEEEFFISGPGRTYEWVGQGPEVKVITDPVRYTTRILVRRPRDATRFSGNVEVNVLNASGSVDAGAPGDFEAMVSRGDVWIGVTTKSLTAQALKRFNAERYAAIDWPNPTPKDKRCARPSILPTWIYGEGAFDKLPAATFNSEQEDGLVWDILTQVGRALKGEERARILPGFSTPWLFMTGASQSANYVHTWIRAFHARERLADGKAIYDGYLPSVGAYLMRINQCSRDITLQEALSKIPAPDVPVLAVMSEAEIRNSRFTFLPDVVRPRSGWITYQVAGGTHGAGEVPGVQHKRLGMTPRPETGAAPQRPPSVPGVTFPPDYMPNDLAWAPVLRMAYVNLIAWARDGVVPPQAQRIQLDANLAIVRDAHGNALGGLRLPYVDVPVASYRGSIGDGGLAGIIGSRKPFDEQTLRTLYPSAADYTGKFNASTDALVKQRFISPEDGAAMKAAAAKRETKS
jgi:hypothetical protein